MTGEVKEESSCSDVYAVKFVKCLLMRKSGRSGNGLGSKSNITWNRILLLRADDTKSSDIIRLLEVKSG